MNRTDLGQDISQPLAYPPVTPKHATRGLAKDVKGPLCAPHGQTVITVIVTSSGSAPEQSGSADG